MMLRSEALALAVSSELRGSKKSTGGTAGPSSESDNFEDFVVEIASILNETRVDYISPLMGDDLHIGLSSMESLTPLTKSALLAVPRVTKCDRPANGTGEGAAGKDGLIAKVPAKRRIVDGTGSDDGFGNVSGRPCAAVSDSRSVPKPKRPKSVAASPSKVTTVSDANETNASNLQRRIADFVDRCPEAFNAGDAKRGEVLQST